MLKCWEEDPSDRPTFTQILSMLNYFAGINYMFGLLKVIDLDIQNITVDLIKFTFFPPDMETGYIAVTQEKMEECPDP